jgi:hypothetical protein
MTLIFAVSVKRPASNRLAVVIRVLGKAHPSTYDGFSKGPAWGWLGDTQGLRARVLGCFHRQARTAPPIVSTRPDG